MAGKFTEEELNDITVRTLDYLSESKIAAFQEILGRNGVPENMFSFGRLKDGAVCIINNGSAWEVFFYERREKINLQSANNISEAILAAVDEIAEDDAERQSLMEQFERMAENEKDDISPSAFSKALKKALSSVAVF